MFTIWRGSLYGETDLRISKESVSDKMFTLRRCSLYRVYTTTYVYGEFTVLHFYVVPLRATSLTPPILPGGTVLNFVASGTSVGSFTPSFCKLIFVKILEKKSVNKFFCSIIVEKKSVLTSVETVELA